MRDKAIDSTKVLTFGQLQIGDKFIVKGVTYAKRGLFAINGAARNATRLNSDPTQQNTDWFPDNFPLIPTTATPPNPPKPPKAVRFVNGEGAYHQLCHQLANELVELDKIVLDTIKRCPDLAEDIEAEFQAHISTIFKLRGSIRYQRKELDAMPSEVTA